jgi:putative sugar O-methyltransferase
MSQKKLKEMKKDLPEELVKELSNYLATSDFAETSKYWKNLVYQHVKMISNNGIENYGTTVAMNYFTWKYLNQKQLEKLMLNINPISSLYKIQDGMTFNESIEHNLIVDLLHKYVNGQPHLRRILNSHKYMGFLDGNSPHLELEEKFITQDLLNTIVEYDFYSNVFEGMDHPRILEIGAGSGRTLDLILNLHPRATYVVVDIPPASYLAKLRIQRAHPDAVVQMCRSGIELELLLEKNNFNVVFIPPSLASYLPDGYFDIMLAVDCLHEMKMETRKKYADLATRVSKFLYVKIWERAYIPVDRERIDASDFAGYGFSPGWQVLAQGNAFFPGTMYEYLFQVDYLDQRAKT